MYIEIPAVEGTPASRIAALHESRELLKGEPKTTTPAMFGGGSTEPGIVAGASDLIRLATYIETGHDYIDTHPTGKRRPIIRNTNITVVSPGGASEAEIAHLMHHINEDLPEFLKEAAERLAKNDGPAESDEADQDANPDADQN